MNGHARLGVPAMVEQVRASQKLFCLEKRREILSRDREQIRGFRGYARGFFVHVMLVKWVPPVQRPPLFAEDTPWRVPGMEAMSTQMLHVA